eukprot:5687769-Amphidinium_carterae.1
MDVGGRDQTESFDTFEASEVNLDTNTIDVIKVDSGVRYILCGSHRNTLVRADLVRAEHHDVHPGKLRPEAVCGGLGKLWFPDQR